MDLKAGGEISDSKIGTTPHALIPRQVVRTTTYLEVRLHDSPLNTELETKSAGGELTECARENPERDKYTDEDDEYAEK